MLATSRHKAVVFSTGSSAAVRSPPVSPRARQPDQRVSRHAWLRLRRRVSNAFRENVLSARLLSCLAAGDCMKLPNIGLAIASRIARPSQSHITPAGHCGTSWHEPLVPDRWGDADFSTACKTHDQCYSACGSRKATCDRQFEREMEATCSRAYPGGGFDYVRRNACIGIANTYAVAVEQFGDSAYREAQHANGC